MGMSNTSPEYVLEFRNICKRFPGVKALDNVSFGIRKGCVHVLIGENGAGKSTLLKIINGLYKQDEGQVLLNGEPVTITGPSDALKKGIAMIYQELNVVPEMTVLENIYLGREKMKKGGLLIDYRQMAKTAQDFIDLQGIDCDVKKKMKELSIAEAQMIEIAKATMTDAQIVLMDEPTSSLSGKEVQYLFDKIRFLKEQGITVVFISHKMEELFEIGDYITVLRDGTHINTLPIGDTNVSDIIEMMVGRKMTEVYPQKNLPVGQKSVFKVENFTRKGVFENISFELREGEILGIGGLVGAGRSEVARAIIGLDPKDEGEVYLEGKKLKISNVNDSIRSGIVMIPEDRRNTGLILKQSVEENIGIVSYKHVFNKLIINWKKVRELVKRMIETLEIKTPSPSAVIGTLSGGNQQKVVLGKWLSVSPKILIMDEPTRGIDVKTKYEIYKLMHQMNAEGVSIIMINSDLEELLGMSDRVLVISHGQIAGELNKEEINANAVMKLAVGG